MWTKKIKEMTKFVEKSWMTYDEFATGSSKNKMLTVGKVFHKQLCVVKGCGGESANRLEKAFKTPIFFYKSLMDCAKPIERQNMVMLARIEDESIEQIKEKVIGCEKAITSTQLKKNVAQDIMELFTQKKYREPDAEF